MVMNKSLQVCVSASLLTSIKPTECQEVNIQNMNVELVAQMFKNYQSNVLFHLEGMLEFLEVDPNPVLTVRVATDNLRDPL